MWRLRVAALVALAGPLAIAAAGGVMLAWTWRTWPDVVVDFGRELYVAWQVAEGKALYLDVATFFGPLSPYLNALWFRLFGVSFLTLALANVVLATGLVALLYGLLARVASRLAATAACLTFVTLFACVQYTRIGNYNWVCPYSHELTHGVILAVAGLWCLDRYHRTRRTAWMAAVGLAAGLLVLTKAEPLLAGGAALATGVGLTLLVERPTAGRALRCLALVAGFAAVPLAVTAAAFVVVMPLDEVLRWPLGHWAAATRPELRAARFYTEGMGFDDVAGNLSRLLTAALAYVAVLGPVAAGALALRRVRALHPALVAGVFLATVALLGRIVTLDMWLFAAPRPLPLFMALLAGASLVEAVRRRAEPERALRAALRAALAIFALVLIAKIVLNVRIFHYGFALAMPATLVLVVAVVEWLPAAVGRLGGHAAIVRAVALGALVAAIGTQLGFAQRLLRPKVHVVGAGADAFYADDRAIAMNALLDQIRGHVGLGQTLVALPEGAMLSYLARRANPTPYYLFDGTSIQVWDEARIVRTLEAAAPDYVAFVDRGISGPRRWIFGQDYGLHVYAWATAHYHPVWQRGALFAGLRGMSVMLLRRNRD